MEPEGPSDLTPSGVRSEPVTEDVSIDEVLTPVGAEAVSCAVPAEALVQSAPTDDALGPAIPTEALFGTDDPAEALAAAVASDLPPGTIEVTPPADPAGDPSQSRTGRTGAVILEWPHPAVEPAAAWPQSMRTVVSVMLASGFPTLVMWGRGGTQLYNDACRSALGATKAQAAFGQRSSACWSEICETLLEPMFQQVMSGAKPVWIEDLMLVVDRSGYFEEAYFTFSCGAIRDAIGEPIGMLATFVETTARVLGERRLRMLGELSAHASAARTFDVTCRGIASALETCESDIPFYLLYLVDADGRHARLCASAGVAAGARVKPGVVSLSDTADESIVWPLARVVRTGQVELCSDLTSLGGSFSGGPWSEDAQTALAVPIVSSSHAPPMGVLVAGISPRRALDDDYRGCLALVGAQIATAFSNARAYEAERQRSETLATQDRARTAFFTRIGDEFRTPLAQMLGPAGDLLAGAHGPLSAEQREQIAALHSSAGHLLKLADTLLEFLRTGAGTVDPGFEPADFGFVDDARRWIADVAAAAPGGDTEQPAALPAAVDHVPDTARILIADDHTDVRNYLTRLLGGRWTVEAVADGGAALDAIRAHRPDLVIADVVMPGLDGLDLLRALRAEPDTSTIPVLLLSGRAAEAERVQGLEAGAADYVSKPFSGRELVAKVQTHIELSRLRAQANLERTRQLEHSMASRDAFFAAASHELRNPIHSLQLQLLAITRRAEREAAAPELEWVHARLATATKQLSRLTRLVDTLLDVSRIASGRLPLVLEDVDLAEIVADAFERLDPAEQAQITLRLAPAAGRWDRLRLDQVVTNLVSNAIKYGEGQPIDIVVSATEGRVRLEVTDHGIGIASHHQERVFERFERAVSDRRYTGFGLGLWITSRIVEESSGILSLRSELGVGSTFIVELPTAPTDQP
jgi:signal transduction histidine kinase